MSKRRILFKKIVLTAGKHGAKSLSSPPYLLPYQEHHIQFPLSPKNLGGSKKPAGTGVGRNTYPNLWLGSWAAQIGDWEG